MKLTYQAQTKDVQDLFNQYERNQLELCPVFQRESVWSERDRAKLIDTVLRGFPIPAIFLSKRTTDDGFVIYDVIDGKQRLETLLKFAGLMRGRFSAPVQLPGNSERERVDWKGLRRRQLQHLITHYKLQVIEVDGPIGDVMELFVRINSTGKPLSGAEKRHARYNRSPFLRRATRLAEVFESKLISAGVLGATQVSRMKHIELACELMLSALQQGVLNKKSALDKVMGSESLTPKQIDKSATATTLALNRVLKILPNIKQTRFRQVADFYSLVVLMQELERDGLALADRRASRLAGELLTVFSDAVDSLKERGRKIEGARPGEELFRRYLLTVKEGTDEVHHRRERAQILSGLIRPLFERRDDRRLFSPEQRRILWNQSDDRRCAECRRKLTWDDFTIDHIRPWSKAGKTELKNAALMCAQHNSAKSNRRVRRAA